jgi:GNAT superfamily N-acetyltransferase
MYIVRDALEIEVFQLTDISERVLKESPTYTHMSYDKEKSANYIYGAIAKQPGWFLRVIAEKSSGRLIGGILCFCETVVYGPDKQAYDVTIMIDEEHRGKCTKQIVQIIEEYKEWALKEGAKVIKMGVSSGLNIEKASLFFEKLGYKQIGAMHAYVVGE